MTEEKKIIQQSLEENIRKDLHGDFENRLSLLQQSNEEQQEKLKPPASGSWSFCKKKSC